MIAVEDEGRGIPAELRERVFDKFFRATSDGAASLGRPRGLGIGLAIARGIVEAHGGRIWVESGTARLGARVAFTVPIGDEEIDEEVRHDKALTHRTLLGAVWGGDYVEQTEYLRVLIGQLRKKIEADPAKPRYILTEPWVGYRFNTED
jgi:hypothetical protein